MCDAGGRGVGCPFPSSAIPFCSTPPPPPDLNKEGTIQAPAECSLKLSAELTVYIYLRKTMQ